jgi:hypothetical protein
MRVIIYHKEGGLTCTRISPVAMFVALLCYGALVEAERRDREAISHVIKFEEMYGVAGAHELNPPFDVAPDDQYQFLRDEPIRFRISCDLCSDTCTKNKAGSIASRKQDERFP